MEISNAAVGMLAGVCLVRAGGAYIATRSRNAPAVTAAAPEATVSPDPYAGGGR